VTDYSSYPKAPYLTDNNANVDLTPYDFVVASILDGMVPSSKFNTWVDMAYRAKKPMIGVVKIDPAYYGVNTLGFWPPPENDLVFKMLRTKLLAPDGVTKYKVDAILIDTRTYYDKNGNLYGGNWIDGVTDHIREWLTKAGFKTFLLSDNSVVNLYPNSSQNPAVMLASEKLPIAVYQKGNLTSTTPLIPWASSAFLWWYGTSYINNVLTPMFCSLLTMDKLMVLLGLSSGTVTPPPVVVPPTTVPTEIGAKLDLINSKLDVILKYIQSGG
jgi:hypothetical protein